MVGTALKAEHPDTMGGPDGAAAIEVFRRKWIYYLCVHVDLGGMPQPMMGPALAATAKLASLRGRWAVRLYVTCVHGLQKLMMLMLDHIVAFSREGNEEYRCQVFS